MTRAAEWPLGILRFPESGLDKVPQAEKNLYNSPSAELAQSRQTQDAPRPMEKRPGRPAKGFPHPCNPKVYQLRLSSRVGVHVNVEDLMGPTPQVTGEINVTAEGRGRQKPGEPAADQGEPDSLSSWGAPRRKACEMQLPAWGSPILERTARRRG